MSDFTAIEIVKEFTTPAGPLRILDGVTVELDRGESLAVVGESGSGKSTFLHIAGTLDSPTSGTVTLLGEDPSGLGEKQLASFRNKRIGFVFQQHHLLPQLSALENVLIPALAMGKPTQETIDRGRYLLEHVGLAERMTHRPGVLSGGECQRVAVARALIENPDLVLADEPTGSLDEANAQAIGELLLEMQRQIKSVLICVTHSEKIAGLFGSCARLKNGRVTG